MDSSRPPAQPADTLNQLELDAPLLSDDARRRVLDSVRLKLALSVMLVLLIVLLSGMMFLLVTNIFDSLTPPLRNDLMWKAQRGAAELGQAAELGVAAEDATTVAHACAPYTADSEVKAIVVALTDGRTLYRHGQLPLPVSELFDGKPSKVSEHESYVTAWSPVEIEGLEIGKIGLVVSTHRLAAGLRLESDLLTVALVGAFIALLAALAFVNLYIGPILRVTENTFAQLQRTTELALESARLKSQFLANMSHEIRTPMNGVLGMTRLILNMGLEPKLRRYIETVDASGRALMTIINDILDFSKIESGKYTLQEVDFDLRLVTQEVVELFAERAHAKQLELVCRFAPDVPERIIADPDRYRQVLSNLVGNAIKFTEEGEVFVQIVRIDADGERGPFLRFEVSDTGIGIPPDAFATIFESFSQQDGSSVRVYGGTGLGLAISRRLLEMMGGEIGLQSTPGEGSTFHFTLPERSTDARPQPARAIEPTGRRALVVDANEHARQVVLEHLQAWGMRCEGEASGQAALARLRSGDSEPFDVAIVAARTSDLSGEEVVRLAGADPRARRIPMAFLSQLSSDATRSEVGGAVIAHLSKPIRISDLYDCLVATFSGGHSQRPAHRSGARAPAEPKPGVRVLVVDDNEVNQFVAAEQVAELGYEVDVANDGAEAVEKVAAGGYAAVLMDCQMPIMDGYEATRRIRARERAGTHVPIIALTAHALMGERDKVLSAGMDDYLTKPVRPDALRKVLAHLVDHGAPASAVRASSRPPAGSTILPDIDPDTQRSPKVIALVKRHLPAQIDAVGDAVERGDAAELRAQAHKLKGSAASIGALRLGAIAAELQVIGESTELVAAAERMASLRVAASDLFTALEGEVPAGAGRPSGAPSASA